MSVTPRIPTFAVLGHPNEGKSSVVSTLTEDDKICVSRIPGETIRSQAYTVAIDDEPVISFVDTPGFQVPRQTLEWFRKFSGPSSALLDEFIETHRDDPFFADECELLLPLTKGAGIIYVVNGSRPVRPDDLMEMEILRLTGKPRMAMINAKTTEDKYIDQWKEEFRKHFNAIRTFNSNTADFQERIRMLESLASIDQEWEKDMERVVEIFKDEMNRRKRLVCAHIIHFLEKALGLAVSQALEPLANPKRTREKLEKAYENEIRTIENSLFREIRALFKHTLYEVSIEEHHVLSHDLFSQKTWEVLGLTKSQLTAAGAVLGGSMGVVADVAAQGISFGIFTLIGGILGAGSALAGGKKLAKKSVTGKSLGGDRLQLGPSQNLQFLFVLLDRALLYYAHIINRAHGKRDNLQARADQKQGVCASFSASQRTVCTQFFKAATRRQLTRDKKSVQEFTALVQNLVDDISGQI